LRFPEEATQQEYIGPSQREAHTAMLLDPAEEVRRCFAAESEEHIAALSVQANLGAYTVLEAEVVVYLSAVVA
jgi:hypothetical protein